MYNHMAADQELTMSMGFILLAIGKEGILSTQLGPKMGMEPTSLSRTLKLMEDRELIYRVIDKKDKRKVHLYLTDNGIVKRKVIRNFVVGFNERIFKEIAPTKMKAFYEVAEKVDRMIEEELARQAQDHFDDMNNE
jgi:DNA-binding MarR family transcriptional regulator